MLTKNNWFNTTLYKRLEDKTAPFSMVIGPYLFHEMSFDEAANYTCREIAAQHKNLYLALSGGLDSEFVLRCFHRNGIDVKPVIVRCGNPQEIEYAISACTDLNVTPIIIDVTEEELVGYFKTHVVDKFGGVGYNSVHNIIAAEYVSGIDDAVILSGNHFLSDDHNNIRDDEYFLAFEWDFYADYFQAKCNNINFYAYTIEIVYAAAPKGQDTWVNYKHDLFGLKYREKMRHSYSEETMHKLIQLTPRLGSNVGEVWSKTQFFDRFDKYRIGSMPTS